MFAKGLGTLGRRGIDIFNDLDCSEAVRAFIKTCFERWFESGNGSNGGGTPSFERSRQDRVWWIVGDLRDCESANTVLCVI